MFQTETNQLINQLTQNSICKRRETSDERLFIMQNEPNFKNGEMNVTALITKSSENLYLCSKAENEPKRTQNEPNFSPKLASFLLNKPNFKPNSVKIGNLQRTILPRTVYSVFCVLCSVFFLPPFFVANNWLCFSPKIAVKWHAKNNNVLTLWLSK